MITISRYEDNHIYFHHVRDEVPNIGTIPVRVYHTYGLYGFINGSCRYKIEGNEYVLNPGCILLIRPSEAHKIYVDSDCNYERIFVNFTEDILKTIDPDLFLLRAYNERSLGHLNMYSPRDFSVDPLNYIHAMCPLNVSQEERRLIVFSNLISILNEVRIIFNKSTEINKYYFAKDDTDFKLIEYINSNIFNPLSIDMICKRFFISKTHLERKFKSLTGSTIFEYITMKRLVEAQRLLLQGEKSTIVSKFCGYSEYSTFFRAYKKQFGISPSYEIKNKI